MLLTPGFVESPCRFHTGEEEARRTIAGAHGARQGIQRRVQVAGGVGQVNVIGFVALTHSFLRFLGGGQGQADNYSFGEAEVPFRFGEGSDGSVEVGASRPALISAAIRLSVAMHSRGIHSLT
jgi:hypothetical protein